MKVAGTELCWHATDLDPVTPHAQYDCTFVEKIHNAPRSLLECTLDTEQLCWDLVPVDGGDGCLDPHALRPRIPGYVAFVFSPTIHVECAL